MYLIHQHSLTKDEYFETVCDETVIPQFVFFLFVSILVVAVAFLWLLVINLN